MHPVLGSRRRLLLYLLAWTPIVALLAFVTRASSSLSWLGATEITAPACLLYAFICLSSWYVCRARPLRPGDAVSLLLTFAMTASASGLLLAGSAWAVATLLQKPSPPLPLLFGMGVLLYFVSVGLHYAALAAEASRQAERREAEARTLAREAELQSLRIQLNPHFLFNSLHSISALTTQDGNQARTMCLRLADFLRSSLKLGRQESIALGEELALARSYLEVEQVRFGNRLRIETDLDGECVDCAVPALILQPLVENAVKHGIAGLVEGGAIRLTARRDGADVVMAIENQFDPDAPAGRSLGMGLQHVIRRLQVRYAGQARFEAAAEECVYRVSLRFPCESLITSSSRA